MGVSKAEREKRRRIQVALWAYAYEIKCDPIADDATFDRVCREVNLEQDTGDVEMDRWFRDNFDPCTGSWVYKYPYLGRLEDLFNEIKEGARCRITKPN